ncbi:type II secretion system F family protein [Alienimonas californiensis]|uniref:Type IV pilin biogenesis protein n=1 Tax=Alienimonas californiensis TaxID=2527989 RepID=A0A517P990_9PLAN|nr:type II secretion system F family protein [Alienimonas californiensis]QDT15934.1 type IV pilin biogenesis protein [Alienimonas californiensis]
MLFGLFAPGMFFALMLVSLAAAWALARRTRRLRAAALMGELAVAAKRELPMAEEFEGLGETLLRGDRERVRRAAAALDGGADLRTALRAGTLIPAASEPALAAGEASGTLPKALADEAARLARQAGGSAGAFWNVGFYLLATLFAVQAVLGFLMYYIVPKFKKIFEDFGLPIDGFPGYRGGGWLAVPWSGSLIEFSAVGVTYGLLPLAALQLAAFALPLVLVVRQKGLRLPGGRLSRRWFGSQGAHASRVTRALANAAEVGRPFPPVLTAYAAAANSRGPALAKLARRVEGGADVWPALRDARLLTAGEARLAATGTAAGNLPTVLRLIADRRDAVEERRRGRWLALLQPAAVLLIGALVCWVALAFFTPLIRLLYDLG